MIFAGQLDNCTYSRKLYVQSLNTKEYDMLLPTRTIETQTRLTVDIQHRDERDGRDAKTLFLVVDGECYALTKSDAERIGDQLQAFAREMRATEMTSWTSCRCGGVLIEGAYVHTDSCDRDERE